MPALRVFWSTGIGYGAIADRGACFRLRHAWLLAVERLGLAVPGADDRDATGIEVAAASPEPH